jgi:hypothetical protein
VDQHSNSALVFEDRRGWNVYKDCLKRRQIDSLAEPAQIEQKLQGALNELEWIFVFERFGSLAIKDKSEAHAVHNSQLADVGKVKTREQADAIYILDLRYIFCCFMLFLARSGTTLKKLTLTIRQVLIVCNLLCSVTVI